MIQRCDVVMRRAPPKASAHTGAHTHTHTHTQTDTHISVFSYLLCLQSNLKCISSTKMHECFLGKLVKIVSKGAHFLLFKLLRFLFKIYWKNLQTIRLN
jgi:hypothetical protein